MKQLITKKQISGSVKGARRHICDDALSLSNSDHIYVICDGVSQGGHGGEAARFVSKTIQEALSASSLKLQSNDNSTDRSILEALSWMQNEVIQIFGETQSLLQSSFDKEGSSATTALAFWMVGRFAVIAHLGDTRAYLIRSGKVYQLTQDHNGYAEMIKTGIDPDVAKKHPMANALTRAFGTDHYLSPDITRVEFQAGDQIILATDGAFKGLQEKGWDKILDVTNSESLSKLLGELSEVTYDDASLVLIEFDDAGNDKIELNQNHIKAADRIELIQKIPLCRYMSFTQKAQLATLCTIQQFKTGEKLITEGTEGDQLYILINGLLEITRKSKHVSLIGAGAFVGETGLIKKVKRTATVTAKQTSLVLSLESKDLMEYLSKDLSVESAFYRSMTETLLDRLVEQTQDQ